VRRPRLLALLLPVLLVTGCGLLPGDVDGTPRERFRTAVEDLRRAVEEEVRRAVEEAQQRAPQEGDRPTADERTDPRVDAIRTDTNTRFDYDEFVATLDQVLASLEEFWAEVLPAELGVPYSAPSRYVYYRSDEGDGPRCGGQAAPARNAFYCPAGDFIAWDETGLMIPYYVSAGDFAAAFVLAHEFGHAMQARLETDEPLGVLTELQADCFAGAWARSVQEQGLLEAGDLDEATFAVFSARDVPGTPFTDPAAHGSGFERTRAFSDGYERGAGACVPAPADSWLVDG
jgi:uncharacterized protein